MTNKKKAVIYPFGRQFAPVIRHKELIKEYEIVGLISPKGWGIASREVDYFDRDVNKDIMVYNEVFDSIDSWQTLIIADCSPNEDLKREIIKNIVQAIEYKKDIVCSLYLNIETIDYIKAKCIENNVNFEYFYETQRTSINIEGRHLIEIGVPVVFVAGLTENTDKFEIILSNVEKIIEKGYKVSTIATRNYSRLFGMYPFPNYMLESGNTEIEKIIGFNRYVKMIEENDKPDMIIIGVPGGLMPFNKLLTNNFGVCAYLVSQAVTPDFSIVSVLYDDVDIKYFNMLSNSFKYKYGFEVDCYNMSNAQFDVVTSVEDHGMHFCFLNSSAVDDIIQRKYTKTDIPIYNILNQKDRDTMVEQLINTLVGFSSRQKVI